jgi:DNA invertase Pin-like site-specific DNA recombinase
MEPDTTRAAIYSRNSSAKQKSITEQAAENRAAAADHGWTVVDDMSDPVSASRYGTKIRANWTRLLELLPTVDVVVLWEPSRGDRTLSTWVAFLDRCRQYKVRIHAVTHHRTYDPANARDYRSLAEDGVDSAYESDKTSERVHRGLAGALAAGHPLGSLAHGYRRVYDSRGEFVEQLADDRAAPVVRDIFAAVAAGEPLSTLAVRLTRAGAETPRGGRVWYSSTIAGIVRNPAYRPHAVDPTHGRLVHKGRELDGAGAWPPLVDEVTWLGANRVLGGNDELARHRRRDSAPGAVKWLLSGNADVMAAPCGSLLTGWGSAAGRGATYACRHDKCVSAPMPEVDEYVTRLVVARFSMADVRHLWVEDDGATRAAADELARLKEDLAQNTADYRGGVISARLAGAREQELEPLIADAERRSRPAGVPLAALKLIEAAEFGADRVRPTWETIPLPGKRELIAGLFTSLVLGPTTTRITRWTPDDEAARALGVPSRLDIVAARITHEWRRA